jgi:nitroreductase
MVAFDEVVRSRCSARAFDAGRPVPREVLNEVLTLAQRTPSNCNAQPWHVYVVTGARCAALRDKLTSLVGAGRPTGSTTPAFEGSCRKRQVACAVELYRAMGIGRQDVAGRQAATLRNFEFFDAPHVALLYMDRKFGVEVAVDVGAYLQTLLLAFQSRSIASCAQASLRAYAEAIATELGVPEHLQLLCGVSFGYALPDAAVNQVRQERSPIDEVVRFIG